MPINIIKPIDRSLKILARRYPEEAVRFVLQDTPLMDIVTIENPELNIPEKRTDFVYLVNNTHILHLEFQLVHEPDISERMFKYNAFFLESLKKPVISTVLYLERHEYEGLPDRYVVKMGEKVYYEFPYIVVKLWDYLEEIRAGKWRWLLPTLIMLEKEKTVEVLGLEKNLILQEKDDALKADLLSLAITVASRYFDKKFLFNFFKEEMSMLRTASIVEDWIKEGELKGIEKGIKEGMEKGKEEGIIKAKQDALVHILEVRFKKLPSDIVDKIKTMNDPKEIDKLLTKAVTVKNINAFAKLIASFSRGDN